MCMASRISPSFCLSSGKKSTETSISGIVFLQHPHQTQQQVASRASSLRGLKHQTQKLNFFPFCSHSCCFLCLFPFLANVLPAIFLYMFFHSFIRAAILSEMEQNVMKRDSSYVIGKKFLKNKNLM